MKASISKAAAFMRQRLHPLSKVMVIAAPGFVADRHSAKSEERTLIMSLVIGGLSVRLVLNNPILVEKTFAESKKFVPSLQIIDNFVWPRVRA
ncbi:hypothetical protein [Rhizobium etli]|uniref:hypothetical protein n=2 Tax=Rhizobium/Agrobacterium group TaxID=227290 RepID=UPI00140F999B|nr:hypothetical protein [Rhizobium etli]